MTGDIVISNGDQIAQALQPVLDKLAITGSQFWEIYVAYIQMNAILNAVALGILLISTIIAMHFASKHIKPDSERRDYGDEGSHLFWTVASGIVWLIVFGTLLDIATDIIIRAACPEYFAIQNIISQVGGLV